jgi:outer membrane lipoprotein-sorting protein
MKTLFLLLLLSVGLLALTADDIIKKVEHNLQSESGYAEITMVVTTARGERTMKMQSWNRGNEKSFIKILYPLKDRGITFLKIETRMWQYVPRIERTIKIPSSMMMQSWMGSDFTNDDMAKESSIVKDYYVNVSAEDEEKYLLTLLPKEDSAVVWGKIVMEVKKKNLVPLNAVYYDEDDAVQRILYYSGVKVFGSHHLPTVMTLVPLNKQGNKTVVIMDEVQFDIEIDDARFSMSALKRYSR